MEYKDFYSACQNLKEFLKEQDKLNNVVKLLYPSSTFFFEFGNKFIDDYITVVELALGDKLTLFSWFVFENEFGKNELVLKVNNFGYKICNEEQFFDIYIQSKRNLVSLTSIV
ncbi:hypothetical protein [Flavobacterium sp.]|uniref:hypothetical protein n=1 Tax=Flavobacterium sp. TaxID=239 RepID=UPI00248A183D|nr:hypothetical protein [Flavobacterium sp.]MDI1317743.1 hypothetical protein [Flavobacterium sp.]